MLRAARKVAEMGNRASVFGRRHNDHVWIEIHGGRKPVTGRPFVADLDPA